MGIPINGHLAKGNYSPQYYYQNDSTIESHSQSQNHKNNTPRQPNRAWKYQLLEWDTRIHMIDLFSNTMGLCA